MGIGKERINRIVMMDLSLLKKKSYNFLKMKSYRYYVKLDSPISMIQQLLPCKFPGHKILFKLKMKSSL
jgi:hypothetical protein